MKAKRLSEVQELLQSPELLAWHQRYNDLRHALDDARGRRNDLLVQAALARFKADFTTQMADDELLRAGDCEDRAAQAAADSAQIENSSFEMVSRFEMDRQLATDAWAEVDRVEQLLEESRRHTSDLKARADAGRKAGTPEGALEAERAANRSRELEGQIAALAKSVEEARTRQRLAEEAKGAKWMEVESTWSSAFRANLARSEYAYQGRKVRIDVEKLFQGATDERRRVEELEGEATKSLETIHRLEADFEAHLDEARQHFDCALVREFFYWPNVDEVQLAWCVPLIDERNHLNIQIRALEVYVIERGRGLDFLEPVAETGRDKNEGDPRLDRFFREGRPTAPRA